MRVFCSRCGSPIYSRKSTLPGVLRIRAGLINEPLSAKPIAHFHRASKCDWWPITDDLPQFPETYVCNNALRCDPLASARPGRVWRISLVGLTQ